MPSSGSRPARRRLTPEQRRTEVLDAAELLLIEGGPLGMSIDALATEAGVTKQLVYHYFDGREAILAEVLTRAYDRFHAEVAAIVDTAPTFRDKIAVLAAQSIEPSPSYRVIAVIQSIATEHPMLAAAQQSQEVTVAKYAADLVAEEYGIDRAHALVAGATAAAASQGFGAMYRVAKWPKSTATSHLIAYLLAIFDTAATIADDGGSEAADQDQHRRGRA